MNIKILCSRGIFCYWSRPNQLYVLNIWCRLIFLTGAFVFVFICSLHWLSLVPKVQYNKCCKSQYKLSINYTEVYWWITRNMKNVAKVITHRIRIKVEFPILLTNFFIYEATSSPLRSFFSCCSVSKWTDFYQSQTHMFSWYSSQLCNYSIMYVIITITFLPKNPNKTQQPVINNLKGPNLLATTGMLFTVCKTYTVHTGSLQVLSRRGQNCPLKKKKRRNILHSNSVPFKKMLSAYTQHTLDVHLSLMC